MTFTNNTNIESDSPQVSTPMIKAHRIENYIEARVSPNNATKLAATLLDRSNFVSIRHIESHFLDESYCKKSIVESNGRLNIWTSKTGTWFNKILDDSVENRPNTFDSVYPCFELGGAAQ